MNREQLEQEGYNGSSELERAEHAHFLEYLSYSQTGSYLSGMLLDRSVVSRFIVPAVTFFVTLVSYCLVMVGVSKDELASHAQTAVVKLQNHTVALASGA